MSARPGRRSVTTLASASAATVSCCCWKHWKVMTSPSSKPGARSRRRRSWWRRLPGCTGVIGGAEHLLQHRWLARPPVLARRLGSTVKRGLPLCREVFPDLLPPVLEARIDEALPGFDAALAAFCGRNLTLNHGDSHLNNMIVRDGVVRFYDWQTCSINNFAYDLAYFLNGNLAEGVRARHIGELTGLYHAVLTGESGARLSADEVMAEYLAASGVVTVLGAAIAGAFLSGTPKGRQIAGLMLSRIGTAAEETAGARA